MKKKKKYSKRVRVPGFNAVMAGIMPKRTESEVWLNDNIDITELLKYLEVKNQGKEKNEKITVFHAFLAAITKMINEREKLNYYVKRYRTYKRSDISFSFVVKREFKDEAKEELMYFIPDLDSNLEGLSKSLLPKVNDLKDTKKKSESVSGMFDFYAKLPRFLQAFSMKVLKFMDYYQIVPKSIKKGDPNFSTVLISNLGSIKCKSCYHHLNNYGNNSIMVTLGLIHKEELLMDDGSKQIRDMIDIGVTVDERIADGFYFAKSFKLLKYIFSKPELLDLSLNTNSEFEYK